MTGAEIKAFRAEFGLSAAKFASLLGVGQLRTVQRWEAGENQIPGPVALIIDAARDVPQFRRWLERRAASQEGTTPVGLDELRKRSSTNTEK